MGPNYIALHAGRMCKKNFAKKHVWLSIETHFGIFLGFFTFWTINQNIDTQLCMFVKKSLTLHEFLKLGYSFFLISICFK